VFQCLHKLFFSRSEDPIVISEIPNIESVVSHSVVNGNEDEKDDIENDSLANETLKVTGNYSKVTGNHSKVISNSVKSTFVSGGDNMSYDDLEGTLKNTQNEQLELGSTFSLSSSFSRHGLSRFSDVFTLASKGLSSTGMSYKSEE
jgi:tRNA G10  N-methylase Trm11